MNSFFRLMGIVFVSFYTSSCATAIPTVLNGLEQTHQQAILVHPSGGPLYSARLSLWEFNAPHWQKIYPTVGAVLGRNGLAKPGKKKEGDGHTPSGMYDLPLAFGYDPAIATALIYRQATSNDFWVDDVSSPQYNQWVKGAPQANSFEQLKRGDDLYKLGVVIDYNAHPIVPGAGSAIFMHIWRNYHHPTAGCVALSQRHLRRILRHLDQARRPVIVLGDVHGHR